MESNNDNSNSKCFKYFDFPNVKNIKIFEDYQ